MKFRIFRSLLLVPVLAFATPAIAGDPFSTGDGPAGKPTYTEDYSYQSMLLRSALISAPAAPSWGSSAWVPGSGYAAGYVDTYPGDLKRIIDENNEHDRLTYDAVLDAGGCQADYVPFWIAAYCASQAFGGGQSGQFGSAGQ